MSTHTDITSLTGRKDDAKQKREAHQVAEASENLKANTPMAEASILQGLTNLIIINVWSAKKAGAAKGRVLETKLAARLTNGF